MKRVRFLAGAAALPAVFASRPAFSAEEFQLAMERLEAKTAGRLGVAAIDTGTGAVRQYRGDERFAMCSTFKLLAVAAVLHRVDGGAESLDRHIAYGKSDLLDYAPVTSKHVGDGFMTVGALCEAAIELSDNTAANLLLRTLGGPSAWLAGSQTGSTLLRAGTPATWRVGGKSGMGGQTNAIGDSDTRNDVAILWPPNRAPLIVAAYLTGCQLPAKQRDATLKAVAALVAK